MAELKTKVTDGNVLEFIQGFANTEQKKADSLALLTLMQELSGFEPKMWGPTMIGFGRYHYKSERSRQEGDWPLIGFSPRKAAISLYVHTGAPEHAYLLEGLGKYTKGAACIYVKKLSDLNLPVLENLIKATLAYMREKYPADQAGNSPQPRS
jgi:hypothetical protein